MKISKAVQIFALTAFLIICGTLNNTAEATEREIEIYNNTGYTIERLYISPIHMSGVSYWDLLGTRILPDGEKTTVEIADGYKYFEIKIVFANGESREWTGDSALNLEGATKITFSSSDNGRFRAKAD